ncbi:MAG: hypothetical protein RL630_1007 [Verrucomicrobiota bacterium]|jgi:hypothetical protein
MKMTLLLPTLAIGMVLSCPYEASAFGGPPGGPFSNGSYFPNDGTFSAVVRGENLTGTLQFSTSQGEGPTPSSVEQSGDTTITTSGLGGVGSTGVATIYFDGDTYQGNSQGALNSEASTMTVNFQADVQGQGEQTIQVQTPVTTFGTSTTNGTVTVTEDTTFQTTREILYFDSLYLNGAANCKTSNAFPNQKFQGDGEAEFQQLVFTGDTPFLDAVTLPISVTGVRLSSTATSFNVSNVRPPSVNEFSVLVP